MDRWRRHLEVPLDIRLCRGDAVELRVQVDEREILPLLPREPLWHGVLRNLLGSLARGRWYMNVPPAGDGPLCGALGGDAPRPSRQGMNGLGALHPELSRQRKTDRAPVSPPSCYGDLDSTASLVPLMTGLPTRMAGSIVIRSRQSNSASISVFSRYPPIHGSI